jgi:hypothetical protein
VTASRPNVAALLAAAWLLAQPTVTRALYEPAREYEETPAVVARYPDPAIDIATPAFKPGRADFTSQEELMAFVDALAARSRWRRNSPARRVRAFSTGSTC